MKRDGGRAWRIAQLLALAGALTALSLLGGSWRDSRQSARTFEKMHRQYAAAPTPDGTGEAEPAPEPVDFDALRQDWPDVVAWVRWPLMGLDHPILQGRTNDQYLRALPDGSWNNGGSIFLEANNGSVLDWHALVYGHNMRDGSMFGQLKRWLEEDFFARNSGEAYFVLYTPEGVWQYDVFSVERVQSTDPGVYRVGYQPDGEFAAFVQGMRERSLYDMGVTADGTKPVMTLSTCDSAGAAQGRRVALHAVQGRRLDGA